MIQQLEKDERRAIIKSVAVVIALQACWEAGSLLLHGAPIPERMLITRITFWVYFGIIYLYVAKSEKRPFLLWKEERHSFGFYIISVILILLTVIVTVDIIWAPLKYWGFGTSNVAAEFAKMSVTLKWFAIITAAVVEELIFRGYIQSRLQLLFKNSYRPMVISAFCFGLLHMGYGTLINMLVPFIIGLVFSWHYYKYRNIKILMICHMLIDINALFYAARQH
jgi:membrane protease YdiL (CAAX protease family)